MAKPLDAFLVFVGLDGYLVAVDLNDPETPAGFHDIFRKHNGQPGIFEQQLASSPDQAMSDALVFINNACAEHHLKPAKIRPHPQCAAERPVVDGGNVVIFRPKGAATVQNG